MKNKTAQEIINETETREWDKESFKNKFYASSKKVKSTRLNEELKRIKERGIINNQKTRNTTQTDKDKNLFKNLGVAYYD